MIPVLQALPIDWSGESPDNRTKGEVHDLSPQFDLPYRIVVMEKGYFYTDNMYIIDNRGHVLKEDVDYQCLLMEQTVAKKRGLTACAVLVVTNPSVGNFLYIEAQMVGGLYCSLNTAILEQAANVIRSANRKVFWKNLKDKPDSYRPNGHLHALWELFGFTPQTAILHRMTTALDKMSKKEFDNLYGEFVIKFDAVRQQLADVEARLTTHIADTSDPHDVTVEQVHLEFVYNAPPATIAQAQSASGSVMNAYATPLRAAQSIAVNFTPQLQAHIDDYNNPHQDTAAKLGTMTNIEMNQLANLYYNRGDTTTYAVGLGGLPWANFYQQVRANLPAAALTTGFLPWQTFSGQIWQGSSYVLAPSIFGILGWRSIASIFSIYAKRGNDILYIGALPYAASPSVIGSMIGTNWPNGTIVIYRSNNESGASTGNGGLLTVFNSLAMATISNGTWYSPGWR
jgi:hypothetical protein